MKCSINRFGWEKSRSRIETDDLYYDFDKPVNITPPEQALSAKVFHSHPDPAASGCASLKRHENAMREPTRAAFPPGKACFALLAVGEIERAYAAWLPSA